MSELKKYKKSVPSGGMGRPASSGSDSRYIRTPPKPEMGCPVPLGPIVAEGTIDGFGKWALDDAGLLVINGKGKMPDWDWDNLSGAPWRQMGKEKTIKRVHISDGVTTIGKYTFYSCANLTSILIPNGVKNIGQSAFNGCNSLTSILIPDSVTTIGDYAFESCWRLTTIHIPDNVTSIGRGAFHFCESLTSIRIPSSVTDLPIHQSVESWGVDVEPFFWGCKNLRHVTMPRCFNTTLFFKTLYGVPKRYVTFI